MFVSRLFAVELAAALFAESFHRIGWHQRHYANRKHEATVISKPRELRAGW